MEKQWRDMIQQIWQPKIILILVFIIGIALDGSLYLYKVMPQFIPMHNMSVQHDQLEKQRLALEKSPTPPRILPAQIQALVEQVPISKNSAAFLISIRDLELRSGIVIESVSDGSKKDAINELITSEGKANIPNANYNTQKSKDAVSGANSTINGTTPTPEGTATAPSTTAGFAPTNLELSILGSYSELMDFMNRLAELPRFVKVNEWTFGDSTSLISPGQNLGGLFNDPASTPDPSAMNVSNKKRLTLKLAIYSAAQFKNQFPDLPPVSITVDPENRLDPTLSDNQYNKILDSLRENKIK